MDERPVEVPQEAGIHGLQRREEQGILERRVGRVGTWTSARWALTMPVAAIPTG
jgi:hypothetical protein